MKRLDKEKNDYLLFIRHYANMYIDKHQHLTSRLAQLRHYHTDIINMKVCRPPESQ